MYVVTSHCVSQGGGKRERERERERKKFSKRGEDPIFERGSISRDICNRERDARNSRSKLPELFPEQSQGIERERPNQFASSLAKPAMQTAVARAAYDNPISRQWILVGLPNLYASCHICAGQDQRFGSIFQPWPRAPSVAMTVLNKLKSRGRCAIPFRRTCLLEIFPSNATPGRKIWLLTIPWTLLWEENCMENAGN